MAESITSDEVLAELKAIRKDLDFIKDHIEEVFMTPEEEAALEEAEKEHKAGKSVPFDELDKEINN